jgi:hypothetical protein
MQGCMYYTARTLSWNTKLVSRWATLRLAFLKLPVGFQAHLDDLCSPNKALQMHLLEKTSGTSFYTAVLSLEYLKY